VSALVNAFDLPIARFLSSEGMLILSGGLTIHNLKDPRMFSEDTAGPELREFHDSIYECIEETDVSCEVAEPLHRLS
jgi:aromatic ring-opening dioxygenase catalytic subunit (LigB family)